MYTQIFPYAITGEGRQVSLSKDLIIWVQATFKKVEKDIAGFVKEDREKALDHEYQRNRAMGRYANELIRIAHENPELRAKLLPLIRTASVFRKLRIDPRRHEIDEDEKTYYYSGFLPMVEFAAALGWREDPDEDKWLDKEGYQDTDKILDAATRFIRRQGWEVEY